MTAPPFSAGCEMLHLLVQQSLPHIETAKVDLVLTVLERVALELAGYLAAEAASIDEIVDLADRANELLKAALAVTRAQAGKGSHLR